MPVALTGLFRWLHRYGFMGPQRRKSKNNSNSNSKSKSNIRTIKSQAQLVQRQWKTASGHPQST